MAQSNQYQKTLDQFNTRCKELFSNRTALQQRFDQVKQDANQAFTQEKKQLEDHSSKATQGVANHHEKIQFLVAGETFAISRKKFEEFEKENKGEASFFTAQLSDRWKNADDNDPIYLDHDDPFSFSLILDYIRKSPIPYQLMVDSEINQLIKAADYFGLPKLEQEATTALKKSKNNPSLLTCSNCLCIPTNEVTITCSDCLATAQTAYHTTRHCPNSVISWDCPSCGTMNSI